MREIIIVPDGDYIDVVVKDPSGDITLNQINKALGGWILNSVKFCMSELELAKNIDLTNASGTISEVVKNTNIRIVFCIDKRDVSATKIRYAQLVVLSACKEFNRILF